VQAPAKALDLSEEVLLGDPAYLYTMQMEIITYSGLISGGHYKLAKRYVKPTGWKPVSMALDRVDYAEKL
jgi:hypothetical protein